MKKESEFLPSVLVVIAAVMWGCIGVFGRNLSRLGFNAIQVTTTRCLVNSGLMFLLIVMSDKNKLKIAKKDIPLFIANGVLSIYIFSTAYQKSITLTNLSTAVVLLYTAPVFVTIMSVILFREKLSVIKIVSLVMCIAGSALVSGVMTGMVMNVAGIGFGLLAGFGYALYSIFSKIILEKYHAFTNIFYTFLIAGILGLLTCNAGEMFGMMGNSLELTLWAVSNGLFTSFIAYRAYTVALTRMKRTKAAIIASFEPVVATIVGILIYKESLSMAGFTGICMVFIAIIMQNIKFGEKL